MNGCARQNQIDFSSSEAFFSSLNETKIIQQENKKSTPVKNSLKKNAKRRKKLSKAEKIKVNSPVKKTQQTLLLSETTDSESETLKARNQDLSNLDSNYNYQDQFATLKYDCNEPIAFNGLDRDELRHVMNERELFAMGAPISKDGTYNVVPKNEFEHNNMQHFTKMNGLKHDDHTWKNRIDKLLSLID